MKDTFKMGAKIFGRIVLANIMAIITVISLSFLSSILFTKVIGYQAYGYHEDRDRKSVV